jgi:hypothetical protein
VRGPEPTEELLLGQLPRTPQAVEKVVVGSTGSLKQLQNTSKPVQNTTKLGFKALERGSENSTREFSTRW